MATKDPWDVVVVGAGVAGLACAGTLVGLGFTPLLISETPKVGWNLRAVDVEGNRGFVQHPTWYVGWGGGWWHQLARDLNAPVSFHVAPPIDITVRGSGVVHASTICSSPSALADFFGRLAPVPLDPVRAEFERVLEAALGIPWQRLVEMADVPLSEWLEEQGADPVLQMLMLMMCANVCETTPAVVYDHVSVFGALGLLRGALCGEALVVVPEPDPWAGLIVPLADAIQHKGGEIWTGRKVAQLLLEGDRAVGVVLEDGVEVRGRAVALATGTSRVPALMQSMPDEVAAAVDHAAALAGEDVCTFTVLGEPVVNIDRFTVLADTDGSNLAFLFPMHSLAPAHTQPGKHFLAAQAFYTREQFAGLGGRQGAVERLNLLQEELFPGFAKVTEATAVQSHRHHWLGPLLHGPKLPSQSRDIDGLWFAGDGSTPVAALGIEAAASAGVLRARQIATSLSS